MEDESGVTELGEDRVLTAERLKAFVDAVVAIAMTLLILPLMESVGDAASRDIPAGTWLAGQGNALFSLVLSFVIIANFWITHHALYARVTHVASGLLWLTIAWMLCIVWLPVATSVVGQLRAGAVSKTLYIGAMVLTSAIVGLTRLYLVWHPRLHRIARERLVSGTVADFVTCFLFALALAVSVAFPVTSYYPMFLLLLTGPLHRVGMSVLGRRRAA